MFVTDSSGKHRIADAVPGVGSGIGLYRPDNVEHTFARVHWNSPTDDKWTAYLNGESFLSFGTVQFVGETATFINTDGIVIATADVHGNVTLTGGTEVIAKITAEDGDDNPHLKRMMQSVALVSVAEATVAV